MDHEIEIPKEAPVMTLPNTVLFPQAILPLYIFEDRYRKMLRDVLDTHRTFVVAGLNQDLVESELDLGVISGVKDKPENDYFEPPHEVATIGMIRACHGNDDGTSNLILQGLVRVRFNKIITESPYRLADIAPLYSCYDPEVEDLEDARNGLLGLIRDRHALVGNDQQEAFGFLEKIHDPDVFIDLASFAMVSQIAEKQQLLETLGTAKRYQLFQKLLRNEIESLKLVQKLNGNLKDDDIINN